jgi:sugar lactone lactonase YvrE
MLRSRFTRIAQLGCVSATLLMTAAKAGAQTPIPFVSSYAGLAAGSSATLCTNSIPTFKGTGTAGGGVSVGDGCLPTQASLSTPSSVAVDAYNNVYISDYGDKLLRVIYQGGAALTATLIAASPNITNFTPVPGHIYTLAGAVQATIPQTGTPSHYYCNENSSGTVALASNGDGCPATEGYLQPRGIAIDGNGNIFIANLGGGEGIRVIYAGGTQVANLITILNPTVTAPQVGFMYSLAGQSTAGFSGDGGNARTAQFENVRAIAVDASGNVYISDGNAVGSTTNSDVRVINGTTGVITTVAAGSSTKVAACPTGWFNGDGPASTTLLNSPYSLFFDNSGNLYIADSCNGRLRMLYNGGAQAASLITLVQPSVTSPQTGYIYTIAGGGTQVGASNVLATQLQITLMQSAGIDHAGNLYITDNTNKYLWRISPQTGIATLIGGLGTGTAPAAGKFCNGTAGPISSDSNGDGCPAVQAAMTTSLNLAGDSLGNVYAVEATPGIVQQLSLNNMFPATNAGTAVTQPIAFLTNQTESFTSDGVGTAEFSDAGNMTCTTTVTGSQGPMCVYNVAFSPAQAGDRSGSLRFGSSAAAVMLTGTGVSAEASVDPGTQTTLGSGLTPAGITANSSGQVYVADSGKGQVVSLPAGSGTATALITGLKQPHQVAIDGNGDLFVADSGNNRIAELPAGGAVVSVGVGLSAPQGVAVDGLGDLFIADTGNNRVIEIPLNGPQITLPFNGLNAPTRVTVDASNNLYVVDSGNQRIVELPFDGSQIVLSLGSTSAQPVAVAVDTAGDIYYADSAALQVLEVHPGTIGTDTLVSSLKSPTDLALDANGSVYVADSQMTGAIVLNRALGNISFPLTNVGQSSSGSITVSNIGNSLLSFPGTAFASATGGTASFAITSGSANGCVLGISVGIGGQCQLNASFMPTSQGATSETATLLTNAVTATPAKAVLAGTGAQLISTSTAMTITSPTTTPIGYGTSVVISTTVTPSSSQGAPTGTITISVDGKAQTPVPYGSGTVTTTLNSGVGTHVVSAAYSGDTVYASSGSSVSFTIKQATTATSLAIAVNSSGSVPTLTFTATVSSPTATGETGTVAFYSGSTSLGTANLAGKTASFTTSTINFSNNSFTAVYSGDNNFSPSTSPVNQPSPDFAVTASSSSVATAQGGVASIAVTLTPLFNIASSITPSCSGLPANSICRFQPTSIPLSGTQPVGETIQIFTNVSSSIASIQKDGQGGRIAWAMLFPIGAGVFALGLGRRRRIRLLSCMMVVMASLAIGFTTGCVKSQTTAATPTGTQTVTVNFTSSGSTTASHAMSFSFTVNSQ